MQGNIPFIDAGSPGRFEASKNILHVLDSLAEDFQKALVDATSQQPVENKAPVTNAPPQENEKSVTAKSAPATNVSASTESLPKATIAATVEAKTESLNEAPQQLAAAKITSAVDVILSDTSPLAQDSQIQDSQAKLQQVGQPQTEQSTVSAPTITVKASLSTASNNTPATTPVASEEITAAQASATDPVAADQITTKQITTEPVAAPQAAAKQTADTTTTPANPVAAPLKCEVLGKASNTLKTVTAEEVSPGTPSATPSASSSAESSTLSKPALTETPQLSAQLLLAPLSLKSTLPTITATLANANTIAKTNTNAQSICQPAISSSEEALVEDASTLNPALTAAVSMTPEDAEKIVQDLSAIAQQTQVKKPIASKVSDEVLESLRLSNPPLAKEIETRRAQQAQIIAKANDGASTEASAARLSAATPNNMEQLKNKVMQRVRTQIKMSAQEGGGEILMRLRPEFLGEVKVKLVMNQNETTAQFIVDNNSVKEILQRHLPSLQEALAEKGIHAKSMEVSVSSDGGMNNSNGGSHTSVAEEQAAREWMGSFRKVDMEVEASSLSPSIPVENGIDDIDPKQLLNVIA